jgi:AraC family transcriptional regulator of arabinose operon
MPRQIYKTLPSPFSCAPELLRRTPDARIRSALEFIHENLRGPIHVAELAESAGLSPSRFSHLFVLATGVPPGKFLRLLRLWHARRMFESTRLTTAEILARVGWTNERRFLRLYKNHYGELPRANATEASRSRRKPRPRR